MLQLDYRHYKFVVHPLSSYALSITLCIAIFYACDTTERIASPHLPGMIPSPAGLEYVVPTVEYNSANPYDSVGLLHNEALVYAINRSYLATNGTEQYLDSIRFYCKEFFVNNNFATASEFDQIQSDAEDFQTEYEETLHDLSYAANFTCDSMNAIEVGFINRIGNVFNSEASVSVVLDSLEQIENDIFASNWTNNKNVAYKTISLAKYSFNLWKSLSEQSENRGGSGLTTAEMKKNSCPDYQAIPILFIDPITGRIDGMGVRVEINI